jgi:hypothetical protein
MIYGVNKTSFFECPKHLLNDLSEGEVGGKDKKSLDR